MVTPPLHGVLLHQRLSVSGRFSSHGSGPPVPPSFSVRGSLDRIPDSHHYVPLLSCVVVCHGLREQVLALISGDPQRRSAM